MWCFKDWMKSWEKTTRVAGLQPEAEEHRSLKEYLFEDTIASGFEAARGFHRLSHVLVGRQSLSDIFLRHGSS